MPPKGSKSKPCPECDGRGVIPVGDIDQQCDACDGTGKAKGK